MDKSKVIQISSAQYAELHNPIFKEQTQLKLRKYFPNPGNLEGTHVIYAHKNKSKIKGMSGSDS